MKQLVIMPGGFHPFHAGHLALYQSALAAFPGADVKVAATNDTSARPFPFKLKEKLAQLAGVPPGDFYQVKSPFQAQEITQKYDPADTQLIFVRSEKDADKPPLPGKIKKDGTPGYLQPISDQMAPMTQHAYMAYLPTVEFGPGMTSATQIRTAWPSLTERQRTALVMSLYPNTQKNAKLANTVVKMLDTAMGTELTEVLDTKAGKSNSQWDTSDPDMIKFNFTASNGVEYQLDFLEPYIGPDEMSPYDFFDSDEVYNKSKFVSFEQITKDMKGGYPVAKQGIEGTGSAAEVFGIVVNAIIQYVKKARPALLYFQAAEPNRRALYARMIRRILPGLPGWASVADDAGQFAIYNKRAIKSAMGTEVAEGVPQPGKSSGKPISWISPKRVTTKYLTLNEILDSVQEIPYYNEVVKDRDAKDFTWGVTKKVLEYARELIIRPDAYKNWPPIIVVDGKLQDGAHRISTINLMQKRVQPNNDIWKNAKLKVEFGTSDNVKKGVDEEVTRQMSQGGMTASYQSKYNQPIAEDYLDEARS